MFEGLVETLKEVSGEEFWKADEWMDMDVEELNEDQYIRGMKGDWIAQKRDEGEMMTYNNVKTLRVCEKEDRRQKKEKKEVERERGRGREEREMAQLAPWERSVVIENDIYGVSDGK